MSLIRIRGLTKFYRMGDSVVHALDGVDLDIESGEFVAITGASGSGKSTLMHLIGCLDRPTRGTYMLDGKNVSNLSDRQLAAVRNKRIGFVFQTFNLINRTSALENVAVPLFYARTGQIRGPARKALQRVGLAERATHKPSELSGGERQRVAIARAIVNNPILVLADEPTGNLDSRTGEQIMQVFHDLNAQGVTIVLVTHEPDVAVQARRIVQMRDGKIVSDRQVDSDERQAAQHRYHAQQGNAADSVGSAAIGMPVGVAAHADSEDADLSVAPPKPVRGATSALICAGAALAVGSGAEICRRLIRDMSRFANEISPTDVPIDILMKTGGIMAGFLAALVLAIIAIVQARGALKRVHDEPDAWTGAGRARTATWLGWAVVAVPLVMIVLRLVR